MVYFLVIWNILRPLDILPTWPVGNVVVIWYTFPRLGILCQERSGNHSDLAFNFALYIHMLMQSCTNTRRLSLYTGADVLNIDGTSFERSCCNVF
jgi:hypothetical protein